MKQLMISLDQKILDANSAVSRRMVAYGKENELFILIPAPIKKEFVLSDKVKVWSTGGNKLQQFFRLKKMGKKIIQENNITEISAQDPFFAGLAGLWLKKKTGVKLEIQVHGDFFGSCYYRRRGIRDGIRFSLGKYIVRYATGVRTVSERVKKSLLTLGIATDKIIVRPVPIDAVAAARAPSFDLHRMFPGTKKIFIALGRLDPVKNISWLVDRFAEVLKHRRGLVLLIVGDGVERAKLSARVKQLGLEGNIRFEGWSNDPWSYLKTADALLFPSLSESYGLAAMEAHAVGTPVIMNDVGVANYELKPNGKKGGPVTILSINDTDGWKQAILVI